MQSSKVPTRASGNIRKRSLVNKQFSYLTQQGLVTINNRIKELEEEQQTLSQLLTSTREIEGTRENSHFDALISERELIQQRIIELRKVREHAKIVVKNPSNHDVQIGSTVKVKTHDTLFDVTIVGNWEANPHIGHISYESPVGQALLGKHVGETVVINTPTMRYSYTIVTIS